jgi:hypothetical protein
MSLFFRRPSDLDFHVVRLPSGRLDGGSASDQGRRVVQNSPAYQVLSTFLRTWNPKGMPPELAIIMRCLGRFGQGLEPLAQKLADKLPKMHDTNLRKIQGSLRSEADGLRIIGHNYTEDLEPQNCVKFDVNLNDIETLERRSSGTPISVPTAKDIESLVEGAELCVDIPIVERENNPRPFAAKKIKGARIDFAKCYREEKDTKVDSDTTEGLGVGWSRTKFIRDILQNFLDGHGQTLEGTRLAVKRQGDHFLIRISGQGEYDPEKAIKYGGTSKQNGLGDSAGKHGEGLKVIALLGLRDHGCDEVSFSSRNWRLDYTLGTFKAGITGLQRMLCEVSDAAGNYVELKTKDPSLVAAIFSGIDLVYHPNNNDFSYPDVENEVGGFKIHGPDDDGNLYIARQRVQVKVEHDQAVWQGYSGIVSFWTQKDPNPNKFDREREPLNLEYDNDISTAIPKIVDQMNREQLLMVLKNLEPFWSQMLNEDRGFCRLEKYSFEVNQHYRLASELLFAVCDKIKSQGIKVQFDPKYRSFSMINWPLDENVRDCLKNSLIPCPPCFRDLGMGLFVKPQSDSKLSSPISEGVLQKLAILNRACKLLELPLFVKRGDHGELDEYCPISVNDCALSEEDALREELVWGNNRDKDHYFKIHISRAIFDLPLDQVLGMCWLRAPKWSEPGKIIDLKDCLGGDQQREIRDLAYLWAHGINTHGDQSDSFAPGIGANDPPVQLAEGASQLNLINLLSRSYGGPDAVPADLRRVLEVIAEQVASSPTRALNRFVKRVTTDLNERASGARAAIRRALRPREPKSSAKGGDARSAPETQLTKPFQLFQPTPDSNPKASVSSPTESWSAEKSGSLNARSQALELIPTKQQLEELIKQNRFEVSIPIVTGSGYQPRKSEKALVDRNNTERLAQLQVNRVVETDLLVSYGVRWSLTRVLRDLYQNFLDGQGHTLEGIRIEVQLTPDGGCKLIVNGDGEYELTKAVYLGESESRSDEDAAGKHGEGLKIIALQLLRDKPDVIEQVGYSSRNWKVDFSLGAFEASGNRGLKRCITFVDDRRGNLMEIKFSRIDLDLIHEILSGIQLAYYPQHPDFDGKVYQTDKGGIKVLKPEDKGRLYLARQRYSTQQRSSTKDGAREPELWSGGFYGFVIWFNRDPRKVEYARERGPITLDSHGGGVAYMWNQILNDLTIDQRMSLLRDFEPFWSNCWDSRFTREEDYKVVHKPEYQPLYFMMSLLIEDLSSQNKTLQFPPHYVAARMPEDKLQELGYSCCFPALERLGMKSAYNVKKKLSTLYPIAPNQFQIKKLGLIKMGLEAFFRRSPEVFKDALSRLNQIDQWAVGRQELHDYDVRANLVPFNEEAGRRGKLMLIKEDVLRESFDSALLSLVRELGADYSGLLESDPARFVSEVLRGSNEKSIWFSGLERMWNRISNAEGKKR